MAIDLFESRQVPYLVAVNLFDGAPRFAVMAGTAGSPASVYAGA